MKIITHCNFYEGSPPQGLSEARRGSAVFTDIHFRNWSAAGAPRRGRRGSSQIIMKN